MNDHTSASEHADSAVRQLERYADRSRPPAPWVYVVTGIVLGVAIALFGVLPGAWGALLVAVVAAAGVGHDRWLVQRHGVPKLSDLRWSTALLAALVLAAGACATDQEHINVESDAVDGLQTIEATGIDYVFEDVPETTALGSGMTFQNGSDSEAHQLILMSLPEDEDRPVSELARLSPGELGSTLDHMVGISVAAPGEDGRRVTGELTFDEPGRYALLCLVPTGADPDEVMQAGHDPRPPEIDGGPPHAAEGMYAEVTVES
jgi:hypothetical protein